MAAVRTLPTPPKEFTSDGASGLISAIYRRLHGREIPWLECAIRHDWPYHWGGPPHLKLAADKGLRKCVAKYCDGVITALKNLLILPDEDWPFQWVWIITKILYYAILPYVVYAGVRIGGVWWLPYPSARWGKGYGWPQRGPQDADYVTPPITKEALAVHIRDEITSKEV